MRLVFNKGDFTSEDTWESLLDLAGVEPDEHEPCVHNGVEIIIETDSIIVEP